MTQVRSEREVYRVAAEWAVSLVEQVPDGAWDGPGLGDWDLRGLVGHTSRSFLTIENRTQLPDDAVEIGSAAEYYARTAPISEAGGTGILQRGIEAGAALGEDVAGAFADLAQRALASVSDDENPVLKSLVGGIRLSDYLPTRVFELVVHGLDIDQVIGTGSTPPDDALRSALNLAMDLTQRSGRGADLLLALTGRRALAENFSALRA